MENARLRLERVAQLDARIVRRRSLLLRIIKLAGEAVQASDPKKLEALKQELDQFGKDYPIIIRLTDRRLPSMNKE